MSQAKTVQTKRVRRFVSAVSLAAATMTAMVVAPSSAQATGFTTWTRSCGTTYSGFSSAAFASTEKRAGGSCKGHAWVRAFYTGSSGGHWTGWLHAPKRATYVAANVVIWNGHHKGCADCAVHGT
jgi:hypothetical protein